jgi:hypothetical protein
MTLKGRKPAEQTPVKVRNVELLPNIFATEPNKKMLDSTLDVMTSKGQLLPFKETYGLRNASNRIEEFFQVEQNEVRRESQANNMLVIKDSNDSFTGKVSYYDIENYFNVKGLQLRDGVVLDKNVNVLDLPINPLKFSDYNLYYWLKDDLPPCEINVTGTILNITTELIGKPFATLKDDKTGKQLVLQTGMVLYFTGNVESAYLSAAGDFNLFYVFGVGDSINLIAKDSIEFRVPPVTLVKRPWDEYGPLLNYPETTWDGSEWDGSRLELNDIQYVVQDKYYTSTNHWQASDHWYHISTIRAVANFLSVDVADFVFVENKAQRPIISFNKNIKLYNWPTQFINLPNVNPDPEFSSTVAYLPGTKTDYIGLTEIIDDFGYKVLNHDYVVCAKDADIYKVTGLPSAAVLTAVTTGTENKGVLLTAPTSRRYYSIIFKNDSKWQFAQNRTESNQTPLFEFYNSDDQYLGDDTVFNETQFQGAVILGYATGDYYDSILDKNIAITDINYEVVDSNSLGIISPNQIKFYTEIDSVFSYTDATSGDGIDILGPFGYKLAGVAAAIPFYKQRKGLDLTKQIHDILYESLEDVEWTGEVPPVANGFDSIHIYYDDANGYKFYYDIDGFGLTRFTTKRADDEIEAMLPLILGKTMKIICHDLPGTVSFKLPQLTGNITTPINITDATLVNNNGVSNGIIELYLNGTSIGTEDTKLYVQINHPGKTYYRTAYVKPLDKWYFLRSLFLTDLTNPLYNDFDYTFTDSVLPSGALDYYKQLNATEKLFNKIKDGDKIGVGTVVSRPDHRTAPSSLVNNPLNEKFEVINYYSLYQHAVNIKANSSDIKKYIDSEIILPTNLLGGGTLTKHNDPLAKFAIMATNLPYDFGDLLIKQGKHYDSFLVKLRTELQYIIDTTDLTDKSSLDILDLALHRIYVYVPTDDLFWSHSNMVGWDNQIGIYRQADVAITVTKKFLLENTNYKFNNISHLAGKETLLHITYNNRLLIRGFDYWFNSSNNEYNEIEFSDFYANKTVTIKQWYEDFRSMVPASLAKIGLAPLYRPEIYQDTSNSAWYIVRHDGTRYYLQEGVNSGYPINLVDQYLYEYELAVWSSISYDIEHNDQRELIERVPGYFRQQSATYNQARQLVNNEVRLWTLENNIFIMENEDYDIANGFTLKYQLGSGDGEFVSGSWRAIYKYIYDTDRPHTHPWEMLGYTIKPLWWDTHYSWTDASKRTALEKALRTGLISEPGQPVITNPAFARIIDFVSPESFPVTTLGALMAPRDLTWLSIDDLDEGVVWEPGDQGAYEQVFLNTHRGLAAEIRAKYMLSPTVYVNLNWLPGEQIVNSWGNKLDRTTVYWPTPAINYDYHRKVTNNGFVYTAGIESLFVEHCILQNKNYETEIIEKFNNVTVNKEFMLNAFTNKDNVRIQSLGISGLNRSLYVPDDNYSVRTVKHYPEREFFYSAIRIIWDGTNYSLHGFANEYGYFPYFLPKENSQVVTKQIGEYTFREKTHYTTDLSYVKYGELFSDRQEIYDILVGYGRYLESQGIVYEEPEGEDIRNWQLSAKQFVFWSNDSIAAGSYIDLNPCADFIKIEGQTGQLENLEGTNENIGQCIDRFNKPLFSKDLLVTRDIDSIVIKTKQNNGGIYGIKLTFVIYESVVHLDPVSVFNDVYFDPSQAIAKRSFILGGKKSTAWTGAYVVPGYAFNNNELIPNFDSMVEVGRSLLDIETVVLDPEIVEGSRKQFGLNRNPELRQLFLQEDNEILFKNAISYNKGTKQVFDSLNPLTHTDGSNTLAYEEYMVRIGEMGNTKNIEYYEFELYSTDLLQDTQIIKFTNDIETNNKNIYITHNSDRWVHRPFGKQLGFTYSTETVTRLQTSGPIIIGDTDLSVSELSELPSLFEDFVELWSISGFNIDQSYKISEQVRYNGKLYYAKDNLAAGAWNSANWQEIDEPFLPNIYVNSYVLPNPDLSNTDVGRNLNAGTWQVLQTMDPGLYIMEACQGTDNISRARITTNDDHKLQQGDYILIVNAESNNYSVNGVWQVVEIENETQFYINTRIAEVVSTGKIFTFKPIRFKNDVDKNLAIGTNAIDYGYVWKKKINPFHNAATNTDAVRSNTPSGYNPVYPIVIVDDALCATEYCEYGNYKVYEVGDLLIRLVKDEVASIDLTQLEHLLVYDYNANSVTAKLELFDPQKLQIPKVLRDDIDVVSRVDPAKYNRTTSAYKSIYTSLGWYEEYVGRRWWDTTNLKFNDYDSVSDEVKAKYWGTTVNNMLPEIYEWTRSPVHPSKWNDLVANGGVVFGEPASGQAYVDRSLGTDQYHWVEETDYQNGRTYTVFYFWVKNKRTIASESKHSRIYATSQLSELILKPHAAGIAWWCPISSDSIIVKGIRDYLNKDSTVVQIKKKLKGHEKHQQWLFVSENNTVETIPEWLHVRFRDSIAGQIEYNISGEIFKKIKYIPERTKLHRYNWFGNSIRPYAQSWFDNLVEARRTFLKKLNEIMLNVEISIIPDWPNLSINQTALVVADETIDMTEFWHYEDYRSEDYDSTKKLKTTLALTSDLYTTPSNTGDYIKVSPDPNNYSIYRKNSDGSFSVVYKKNGAIQFDEILFSKTSTNGWDSTVWDSAANPWDFDRNGVVKTIVDSVRNEMFVGKYMRYYSVIMCAMFRYVLAEQRNVDWVVKSSTVEPVNLIAQTLSNYDYFKRDETNTLIAFYSSVKAYRDKIRGGTINKVYTEQVNVNMEDSIATDDITDADFLAYAPREVMIPVIISGN